MSSCERTTKYVGPQQNLGARGASKLVLSSHVVNFCSTGIVLFCFVLLVLTSASALTSLYVSVEYTRVGYGI